MIVPVLQGGIGNQLFQIANAYAYARRHGNSLAINYSLSFCPNQGYTAIKYKDTLYKKIPETNIRYEEFSIRYKETSFRYVSIPDFTDMPSLIVGDIRNTIRPTLDLRTANILLEGYFQSEKYFKEYSKDIRELFSFPSEVIDKVESFLKQFDKPLVGVHIRRGDYKKFLKVHGIRDSSYYEEASRIIGVKKYQGIICSDDWNSVDSEMRFSEAIKSPFLDELEDLYLLSRCDALILSNSSFSWWASYLTKDKSIVIAPVNWFAKEGPQDYYDVFREEWKLI
jgi:hypothetical protein